MQLSKDQEKYVSTPIRSLAQAYVYRDQCTPFGIYDNDKMVGYVMVIYDYELQEYNIWHMMIDKNWQNKGYGKLGLQKCLEYIKTKPFGNSDRVVLTCNENNECALHIYDKFGFQPTGNRDDDEIEMAMFIK